MESPCIVVATDLSPGAEPAARWGANLGRLTGWPVHAAHIIEIGFESWWRNRYDVLVNEGSMAAARARVAQWFEDATGAAPAGVEIRVSDCHAGLTEVVEALGASVLAMAPTGKNALVQAVAGSRVQELAARPPCPLAVVHPEQHDLGTEARIAVAVDFSHPASEALRVAANLAAAAGAALHLVHVVAVPDVPALPSLFEGEDLAVVEEAERALAGLAVPYDRVQREVVMGGPAEALSAYVAREAIDLLVVGRTGHRSVIADVLGSTPRALIRHLPCTVMVAPPPSTPADAG